jgi:hypothetical protein
VSSSVDQPADCHKIFAAIDIRNGVDGGYETSSDASKLLSFRAFKAEPIDGQESKTRRRDVWEARIERRQEQSKRIVAPGEAAGSWNKPAARRLILKQGYLSRV